MKDNKVSPEASLIKSMMDLRDIFDNAAAEEAFEPPVIMQLLTSFVNVINAGVASAGNAASESADASIYLRAVFCHHEGLIKFISEWEPEVYTDESDKDMVEAVLDIREKLADLFSEYHKKFHEDKIIYMGDYEKFALEANKIFKKHRRLFDFNIHNMEMMYTNISEEDVKAVVDVASKFELTDLDEWDAAQAAASHINAMIKDKDTTVKDLDEIDIMGACLGCKVVTNKEEINEFVKNIINESERFIRGQKSSKKINKRYIKIEPYRLSNGRLLIFEPSLISEEAPEEIHQELSANITERLSKGLSEMLKLTPKEKVPKLLRERIIEKKKKKYDYSKVKEVLVSWLQPWIGTKLKRKSKKKWSNGCLIKDIMKHFKNSDSCYEISMDMAAVIGIMYQLGPEDFVDKLSDNAITINNIFDAISEFKEEMKGHGYSSMMSGQIIKLTQDKKEA